MSPDTHEAVAMDVPDLVETDDGLEVAWGSGHVAGPFDPDELALFED